MRKRFASLCVVWGLVISSITFADENITHQKIQLNDEQQKLAQDEFWLTLLYYQENDVQSGYQSFVDDNRFFFAEQGKENPTAELIATLSAFKNSPDRQCLFPARLNWLTSKQPELLATFAKPQCSEYDRWRKALNTETVVLVYASSQLNSPSSMYGHTFIRFDPYDVENHSTLLSHAINFGANIPPNENGLIYSIKGLGGGYPGNFASNPYFEKIKEYNRAENRDLWEFKLNLNRDEIDIMLAHVWELRGINFDYYFFDENCAYRLLELIDIARPAAKLVDEFPGVAIPIDTVRVVRNKGLVTKVHYRPSARTHLDNQLNHLSANNRQLAVDLSDDISVRDSNEFTSLTITEQTKIVHASYRLIRYLTNKDERTKVASKRSFQLLQIMRKHSAIQPPEPERPYRPDLGHDTTMLSVQVGESNEHAFADLTYRASYHDLLDNMAGYDNGMSLNMGTITLRAIDDSLQLQKAELADITSLSPRKDYIQPWSWQANIGIERQWTNAKDELAVQARGGGGVTYQMFSQDRLFFMVTGRIEYNEKLDNIWGIAPGVEVGYLRTWTNSKTIVSAAHYEFIDDIARTVYQLEHNWALSDDYALRVHALRSNNDDINYDEFGLSVRGYF